MQSKVISILIIFILSLSAGYLYAQENVAGTPQEKISKYGNDSVKCIINLSLYLESYKQWKASKYKNISVKDAIKPWRWVFNNCPASRQSVYLDGIKITEWRIKNAENEEEKEKLIDTLMMVYDKRIRYFNKEGYVLGRKGVDLYSYRPQDYEEIYKILGRSVDLDGNNSYPDVLVFYMRAAKKMIDEGKAPEDVIFDIYDKCSKIIDHNLKKYADNERKKTNWVNVKGNIDLTFEPYATCEALLKIYGKKYSETPEDVDLLKKIIKILDKKKCTEDQLYFDATLSLYELDPSPESAFLIGKMLMKKEEYLKATKYLKEGNKLEDTDDVADSYLLLASAYKQLKNFPVARTYALKSLEARPDDGHPLIIIGDMYAESASNCGTDEFTKKVAYWAAVDKFYRAKSIDPEIAEVANSRIATYKAYFPSIDKIFFNNLNEGDDYTVECWINEKTKVRAAK